MIVIGVFAWGSGVGLLSAPEASCLRKVASCSAVITSAAPALSARSSSTSPSELDCDGVLTLLGEEGLLLGGEEVVIALRWLGFLLGPRERVSEYVQFKPRRRQRLHTCSPLHCNVRHGVRDG